MYARPPNQATYAATGYASSQSSQIYGHLPGNRPPIMYHARSFESGLGIVTYFCKNSEKFRKIPKNLIYNNNLIQRINRYIKK